MEAHAAPAPATLLTLEQWADLDEDEPGELVEGHLVEEEMPSFLHEIVVAWLIQHLGAWCSPRGGLVAGSESKIAVAPRRGRKPDLLVYLPGDPRPKGSDALLRTPPSLVVEVISPRPRDVRRDRLEKMDDYAAFGVRFFWLVDPALRTLEIYERNPDGHYVRVLSAWEGTVGVPGCPGLTLDLNALWAQADALE